MGTSKPGVLASKLASTTSPLVVAGPRAFEALTYQSETDLVVGGVALGKTDREAYRIGASRTLGPGVDWDIYVVHETRDANILGALPGDEVECTLLGTAINLSF